MITMEDIAIVASCGGLVQYLADQQPQELQ